MGVLIFVPPSNTDQNFCNQLSAIFSIAIQYLQIKREYISPPDFGMIFNLSISFFFLLGFGLVLLKSKNWRFEQ
jgi:hypothetical protein